MRRDGSICMKEVVEYPLLKRLFLNLIDNFCSLFILLFLEKIAERALDTQLKGALDEVDFLPPSNRVQTRLYTEMAWVTLVNDLWKLQDASRQIK